MPLAARVMFACLLACLVMPVPAPVADPPLRLIVMEPEIDGDTSDSSRRVEWQGRLDLLAAHVTADLSASDLYEVLDPAPAEAEFAKHRRRADVFACDVCAQSVARAAGADRVLSLRVFRMSNLVLSLQAIVRDGPSGAMRYGRALGFRGDNDRAWLKAADYLVRDLAELPPARPTMSVGRPGAIARHSFLLERHYVGSTRRINSMEFSTSPILPRERICGIPPDSINRNPLS